MKDKVRRMRRVQFPATGVQTDIEALLQKFVDSKSIRQVDSFKFVIQFVCTSFAFYAET